MKYIHKEASPTLFEDWKKANEVETPEKAKLKIWDILQNPEKKALRTHLLKEQGYLCCYCNQLIEVDPIDTISLRSKIEHLYPKDEKKYPEKKFTYDNLLVACNGGQRDKPDDLVKLLDLDDSEELGKIVKEHCDTKKGNKEPSPIHPLQENCETFFKYNALGEIEGKSEEANTTISVLGLDIDKLNILRKKAIDTFIDKHLSKSDEEILFELQLLTTKVEDKFNPFCIAIYKYIKNNYI